MLIHLHEKSVYPTLNKFHESDVAIVFMGHVLDRDDRVLGGVINLS